MGLLPTPFRVLAEPTNGLDPAGIVEIRQLIRRLPDRAAVLVSSHLLAGVQLMCDRAVIIDHGRLVTHGRLTVTGDVPDGSGISRPLAEAGIFVSELQEQAASLEEVFLALTGENGHGAEAPRQEEVAR